MFTISSSSCLAPEQYEQSEHKQFSFLEFKHQLSQKILRPLPIRRLFFFEVYLRFFSLYAFIVDGKLKTKNNQRDTRKILKKH